MRHGNSVYCELGRLPAIVNETDFDHSVAGICDKSISIETAFGCCYSRSNSDILQPEVDIISQIAGVPHSDRNLVITGSDSYQEISDRSPVQVTSKGIL